MQRQQYDADHEAFRQSVRAFLRKEAVPYRDKWEQDGIVPRELFEMAGELDIAVDVDASEELPTNTPDPGADEQESGIDNVETDDGTVDRVDADGDESGEQPPVRGSGLRLAGVFGVIAVVALTGICGWLGLQLYQSHRDQQQVAQFLQAARQEALNLTTISHTSADHDVARILDSATGSFHDDFQSRSQQFIDAVEQAQTDSVGTVTTAGLESLEGDKAQVLVAISVKTSNAGAAEQQPRLWRMHIGVDKVGADVKVSNVQFVP
jgi:Mce-associated membrane protein